MKKTGSTEPGVDPPPSWNRVAERLRRSAGDRDARHRALTPDVLLLAGRLHERRVLDVGCGRGALVRVLAERGARVTGIDPAEDAIREGRAQLAEAGLDPRPVLELGDPSERGAFPGGPFDLITALELLDSCEKPVAALQTVARSLRPDGQGQLILAAHDPSGGEPGRRGALERLFAKLRESGLRVVDLREPTAEGGEASLVLLCERRRRGRGGHAKRKR